MNCVAEPLDGIQADYTDPIRKKQLMRINGRLLRVYQDLGTAFK